MDNLATELIKRIELLEATVLEKQKILETLQDSEKRYRRLFESAKDGILILDAGTGTVVDVNPFLLQLLGYSYDDLHGQHIWDLGVFKDIAASKDAFKKLQDNEYIRYEDLPLETHDGQPIAVEFVSNVYLVDHSKVIQCNIRDITANKRARDEHLQLMAQFQQSQKMEAVGQLAGGVAHDFNNMLSVILGNAELALLKVDSAQSLRAYLEEIIEAGRRSADITRQLLSFARQQTISPVILDLNRVVESMLKMLRRLIGENIDLAWLPTQVECPIKIDPVQVDQILANLCVNARDAIADVGKVTIETENTVFDESYCAQNAGFTVGEYVLLAVSDDGHGMAKDIVDRIFEPFFTSKAPGCGTGLGLSTVYGIVKQNNGFIKVYSEPDNGTTFRIYFPRQTGQTVDAKWESTEKIPLSRGETVLIVEDEPALLTMTKMMLEELGYRVLAAGTTGEAIALAEKHAGEIQLLVTDVVMPDMNGRDLARQLISQYPNIKHLFMSGFTANVIARRGVLEESLNFIQKPFSMKDLAIKLRETLNGE